MPGYQNNYADVMADQNNMGQNISRAVLGLAIERQRQQQQQFLNQMAVSNMQRQMFLDEAHMKLWGQQGETSKSVGEFNQAKTRQLEGLMKLSEAVQQNTYQAEGGGTNMAPTLTNALAQAAAARKAALTASTVLSENAYQLLTPHNVSQGGTAVNSLGETLGQGQTRPERPVSLPPGNMLVSAEGNPLATNTYAKPVQSRPVSVAPGNMLFSTTGEALGTNTNVKPTTPNRPFALSPGQMMFSPEGSPLATNANVRSTTTRRTPYEQIVIDAAREQMKGGNIVGGMSMTNMVPQDGSSPVSRGASVPTPPQAAIDFLKKNPNTKEAFDAKYGKGASSSYLP